MRARTEARPPEESAGLVFVARYSALKAFAVSRKCNQAIVHECID